MLLLLFLLLVACVVVFLYFKFQKNASLHDLRNRHVFITGGSKGIGFEMAKICIEIGAHVTIVARNKEDLEKAKLELIKMSNPGINQHVLAYSIDVGENVFNIERAITDAEINSGPIYLLACCAGTSIAKTFEDTPSEEFRKMMDINYFGTVNTVKSCLVSLKKNENGGKILLFSSLAGLFGMYGYSAYSASKFALVGLAECLSMELNPLNIDVTISFPPDTDTPGFKLEQVGKPEITKLISEEGGLFSPASVAKKSLLDSLNGEFISSIGLNGFLLSSLCSGMMPTKSWPLRIAQVGTMGLFRAIGLHFLYSCKKIVRKSTDATEQKKDK